MANIHYTTEQLRILRANPNVTRCSERSITYAPAFKQQAVKQYYGQGLSPKRIFLQAGFDLAMLGEHKPKECLKLWRKVYKSKGLEGLRVDPRGSNRKGKKKPKYDNNNLDYLKTKIAYLEAENAFLKQLKTKPNS